jgi:hypothetical protein
LKSIFNTIKEFSQSDLIFDELTVKEKKLYLKDMKVIGICWFQFGFLKLIANPINFSICVSIGIIQFRMIKFMSYHILALIQKINRIERSKNLRVYS